MGSLRRVKRTIAAKILCDSTPPTLLPRDSDQSEGRESVPKRLRAAIRDPISIFRRRRTDEPPTFGPQRRTREQYLQDALARQNSTAKALNDTGLGSTGIGENSGSQDVLENQIRVEDKTAVSTCARTTPSVFLHRPPHHQQRRSSPSSKISDLLHFAADLISEALPQAIRARQIRQAEEDCLHQTQPQSHTFMIMASETRAPPVPYSRLQDITVGVSTLQGTCVPFVDWNRLVKRHCLRSPRTSTMLPKSGTRPSSTPSSAHLYQKLAHQHRVNQLSNMS